MPEIDVHDYFLRGYIVDSVNSKIIFKTEFDYKDYPKNSVNVIFLGVAGYYFYHDNLKTIIFSIEEKTTDQLFEKYGDLLEEGEKFGWPGGWNESEKQARAYLTKNNLRIWELHSSLGMHGFVIAKSIDYQSLNK